MQSSSGQDFRPHDMVFQPFADPLEDLPPCGGESITRLPEVHQTGSIPGPEKFNKLPAVLYRYLKMLYKLAWAWAWV